MEADVDSLARARFRVRSCGSVSFEVCVMADMAITLAVTVSSFQYRRGRVCVRREDTCDAIRSSTSISSWTSSWGTSRQSSYSSSERCTGSCEANVRSGVYRNALNTFCTASGHSEIPFSAS